MGPRGKIVIGALLAVAGVWWYAPAGGLNTALVSFSTVTNLQGLIAMLQGGLGLLAILIGLFVVWIESDELRIRREMQQRETGDMTTDLQEAVGTADSAADDTDYEEVVAGTVDEVKEAVESQDLDVRKVLEAEQANKGRVTLTDWLEDRL